MPVPAPPQPPAVTLLAGGVGGAKLAHGMAALVEDLTVVVNTGDDFELYGLAISPDLDTVMYTLAGWADTAQGWGVAGDTRATIDAVARLGEAVWFHLGDQDLATHLVRTAHRRAGEPLSQVTARLAAAAGVTARLLPVTDDPVATMVDTPAGRLAFQEYFVARGQRDEVTAVDLQGVADAAPAPGVLDALTAADVVVLAPSNPFVSIGPVLAVPGVRDALAASPARRVAVSPIVGGKALKGPAGKMLASLGHEVSALGVARLYAGLVDVFCLDAVDAALAPAVEALGLEVLVTDTVMGPGPGRERLAAALLAAAGLAPGGAAGETAGRAARDDEARPAGVPDRP